MSYYGRSIITSNSHDVDSENRDFRGFFCWLKSLQLHNRHVHLFHPNYILL